MIATGLLLGAGLILAFFVAGRVYIYIAPIAAYVHSPVIGYPT